MPCMRARARPRRSDASRRMRARRARPPKTLVQPLQLRGQRGAGAGAGRPGVLVAGEGMQATEPVWASQGGLTLCCSVGGRAAVSGRLQRRLIAVGGWGAGTRPCWRRAPRAGAPRRARRRRWTPCARAATARRPPPRARTRRARRARPSLCSDPLCAVCLGIAREARAASRTWAESEAWCGCRSQCRRLRPAVYIDRRGPQLPVRLRAARRTPRAPPQATGWDIHDARQADTPVQDADPAMRGAAAAAPAAAAAAGAGEGSAGAGDADPQARPATEPRTPSRGRGARACARSSHSRHACRGRGMHI